MRVALISFIAGFFVFMFALFTGITAFFVKNTYYGFFFIAMSILILVISLKYLSEDRNE